MTYALLCVWPYSVWDFARAWYVQFTRALLGMGENLKKGEDK